MLCDRCQKPPATVHVDEVKSFHGPGDPENDVEQQHLCEACAQTSELPHIAVQQKTMDEVWKLLQMSALKAQKKQAPTGLTCGDCGLTLDQLRRKGRVGCQKCYDVFARYLSGLLERMHGSSEHVGRVPGAGEAVQAKAAEDPEAALERMRCELAEAIEDEDFERAAELRDELERRSASDGASAEGGTPA